jgi:predicted acetyltransferase
MPTLVEPNTRYQQSYREAVEEYRAEQLLGYLMLNTRELEFHFDAYVERLKNEAKGIGLPEGYVPHTELWLVEGNEYLGRVDIRHQLTEKLQNWGGHIGYDIRPTQRRQGYGSLALQLGLQAATRLGLSEVLVTCDVENVGSNKIIKAHGGVLEDVYQPTDGKPAKNRYWIKNT